jgi:pectate lyase
MVLAPLLNSNDPPACKMNSQTNPFRLVVQVLSCLTAFACGQSNIDASTLPAFPGAEGFGSTTPGGRGGKVLFVTNLNDAGPGSLRAACEAQGPRVVLFKVAGYVSVKKSIVVRNPYLTLAGQSAPGDGICLRDGSFEIATHDVVVRYLRSRLGDESARQGDCISIGSGAHNVILDHCSTTWSVDEALSLGGSVSNVTVQWCLIGEALNKSKHNKGRHGYGSLARANGPVSFHHNLWAHNDGRNPRLGDNYGKAPFPTFDVRNNVMYDYGGTCSGLTQGKLKVNYVANYIRPGPSSKARTPITVGKSSDMLFHIRGNIFEGNEKLTADNSLFFNPVEIDGVRQVQTVAEPFAVSTVRTSSAQDAYEAVLASAGAMFPARDAVDVRIVESVRRRSGSLIDSQDQVGGWPELKSASPPPDSDNDGMPDEWERRCGLNVPDAVDASADKDKDGYTNIEEFLNGTRPDEFIDYRQPTNNVQSAQLR